jgi:hypothetical protein
VLSRERSPLLVRRSTERRRHFKVKRPGGLHGGRPTCESCRRIDVRCWHREGRLHAGQCFSYSWTYGGEPFGSISVRIEADAAVLMFRSRSWGDTEWKAIEQRVPITWTVCNLGGRRPWFCCNVYSNGRHCGRRVAVLYCAGELFACRHCCGLAYTSQHESLHHRALGKAQKIWMQFGGTANMFDDFPDKPKGMHRGTYDRLRRAHDIADERSVIGLMRPVDRVGKRS